MIDMPPILDGFDRESVTWHAYPAASVDATFGERVRGTSTDTVDSVVLHPSRRRQRTGGFDESRQAVEPLAVYTESDVYAGGETATPTEMTRARDGRRYEVVDVGDYQGQAGVTLVLVALIEDPP